MKAKTIEKIITDKINDFIKSVDDKELQTKIRKNVIVTGGCITSMFLKEKVNDYDVYFKDIQTTYKVAEYYAKKMSAQYSREVKPEICVKLDNEKWVAIDSIDSVDAFTKESFVSYEQAFKYIPEASEDVKYRVRCFIQSTGTLGDPEVQGDDVDPELNQDPIIPELEKIDETEDNFNRYKPVYISSNAITLSHKLQIVLRFYGDPKTIHANYDFKHVTNYWTFDEGLVTNVRALECILAKELVYVGSRFPLASIIRMRKFIQRGWTVNVGQIMKMVMQMQKFDLSNPYVLESMITGVDVAYTHGLMYEIIKKTEAGETIDVQRYFLDVLEKIFDSRDMTEKGDSKCLNL